MVTDHVTELPSAREISLTTSFGAGSPGGRVDCARFQCHRATNGLLSAHAALAASATQSPMMTVVPRIRVIASSRLLRACKETPHAELVPSCDAHRRYVRYRRQRFAQQSDAHEMRPRAVSFFVGRGEAIVPPGSCSSLAPGIGG